jgi:hypothetical protein
MQGRKTKTEVESIWKKIELSMRQARNLALYEHVEEAVKRAIQTESLGVIPPCLLPVLRRQYTFRFFRGTNGLSSDGSVLVNAGYRVKGLEGYEQRDVKSIDSLKEDKSLPESTEIEVAQLGNHTLAVCTACVCCTGNRKSE